MHKMTDCETYRADITARNCLNSAQPPQSSQSAVKKSLSFQTTSFVADLRQTKTAISILFVTISRVLWLSFVLLTDRLLIFNNLNNQFDTRLQRRERWVFNNLVKIYLQLISVVFYCNKFAYCRVKNFEKLSPVWMQFSSTGLNICQLREGLKE